MVDGILRLSGANDMEVNDMIEDGGREIDREEVPPSTSVITILGKDRRLLLNGKKDKEMCFNDNLPNFCMA